MLLEELMRVSLLPVIAAAVLAAGCDRQSDAPAQGNVASAASPDGVSPDEVAPSGGAAPATTRTADRSHAGSPALDAVITDLTGKSAMLAAFRGKPVLVNLWATWCAPCVKELPTLDALAKREAGKLAVVAISQDMDAGKVAPFVKEKGITALAVRTDPEMHWTPRVTPTLPTTILYDSAGREVWRMVGDYDWAGADAAKLLAEAK
jgi:thiol-disulfide isomerase/thioredoxin